jgi:hypothetical protein
MFVLAATTEPTWHFLLAVMGGGALALLGGLLGGFLDRRAAS